MSALHDLGALGIFVRKVFASFFDAKGNCVPAIAAQILSVTKRSLPTVAFSGLFVGAILVLQFDEILARFDAQVLLGGLNTSAIVREIGPLIISFLLAAKVGAYTAAELGTMRVTEQIDALECLGISSVEYLVVPRFFGIFISGLILLVMGVIVSVLGSVAVAQIVGGINPLQYFSSLSRFVSLDTVLGGATKSAIYSFIVAAVCCHQGYSASGGAQGVGRAVTRASLYTNLYIVLANYVSGRLIP